MVSLANSHSNATSRRQHLWEIDLRFSPGLPPGWPARARGYSSSFLGWSICLMINLLSSGSSEATRGVHGEVRRQPLQCARATLFSARGSSFRCCVAGVRACVQIPGRNRTDKESQLSEAFVSALAGWRCKVPVIRGVVTRRACI